LQPQIGTCNNIKTRCRAITRLLALRGHDLMLHGAGARLVDGSCRGQTAQFVTLSGGWDMD
jgi:hypothetical protein